MSGHSKWSQIKRQKGVADAKRGQVFTRLAKVISVAAKQGGGDPTMNASLRVAIEQARSANMPKDSIERAIKRGTGELGGNQIEEMRFEAYGPAGVGILIDVVTDNRNRANAEIKAALNKFGGKLAAAGAVAFQFDQRGVLTIPAGNDQTREGLELAVIDSGAADYDDQGDAFEIYADPKHLLDLKDWFEGRGFMVTNTAIIWQPRQTVTISDAQVAAHILRLVDGLEELEDVTSVTGNFDFEPALAKSLVG